MSKNTWISIIEGDKTAFLAFYRDNYQRLYAYGYQICGDKELVKDSIQQLYLELWKSRQTVSRDVDNALTYLMTWLRRIISRQIKTHDKSKQFSQNSNIQLSFEQLLVNQQADDETRQKLAAALQKLTPGQLKIIQARFFDGKSYEDIAIENNMAKQSVYNTIHKVIGILKENMSHYGFIFLFLVFQFFSSK
jgi:RNA polymerase sigma factor (sigma-70 family)